MSYDNFHKALLVFYVLKCLFAAGLLAVAIWVALNYYGVIKS